MGRSVYRRVAFIWGWVFLIVGLVFAVQPVRVGAQLTAWAHLLGLTGRIGAPAGTLWHILALSLMSAITVLAFGSARFPRHTLPYVALLTAKWVSTIGFAWLAVAVAPAWWVCAGGDGFVALTLWWARRKSRPHGALQRPDLARRYRCRAPFYEVWYGKIVLSREHAFWFRYTLLDGEQREAACWAIAFDAGRIIGGKESYDLDLLAPAGSVIVPDRADPLRFAGRPQVFHLGAAHLDARNALGQAGPLRWDLQFDDRGLAFEHVPATLRRLRLNKSTLSSCFLDLKCAGRIETDETDWEFDEAPAMLGHIYGHKQAEEWAWVHCNVFDNSADAVFEGLSARLRLAGRERGPLSSFVLFVDGRRYAFSSVWHLVAKQSDFAEGRWVFEVEHQGVRLHGEARVDPEGVALVEYTDTDDSRLWCRNSKLADLLLELDDSRNGVTARLEASGTAAFEVVNRRRPAGEILL